MSDILICTIPVIGHINQILPLAKALVQDGHRVRWYTGHRFRDKVEAVGALYIPIRAGNDYNGWDLNASFPGRSKYSGPKQIKFDIKHIFFDASFGHEEDVKVELGKRRADLLLVDQCFWAAQRITSVPLIVVGITPLPFPSCDTPPFGTAIPCWKSRPANWFYRSLYCLLRNFILVDVTSHMNRELKQRGYNESLPKNAVFDGLLPYCEIYLQPAIPELEYVRSDLSEKVHFIGVMLNEKDEAFTPPAWWSEMIHSHRPVIYVQQGTVATNYGELLIPTIRALEGEDVLVIASLGGGKAVRGCIPGLDESLPTNCRLFEGYIPHPNLFPHIHVMVSNGGFGGVQHALAHGVPVVVGGISEDKPEVGARVAWSGAGINLKTATPTAAQVKKAVRRLLREPRYLREARRLQLSYESTEPLLKATSLIQSVLSKASTECQPTG